jgi:N-acyl-L-homoserine lactone synthetase
MAVHIKVATSAAEQDALFRARHRVYVEQGGFMKPRPGRRIYDRYDAFPNTINIIAVSDGEVIGGVRLTESDEVGMPAEDYFDFRPYLPDNAKRVGSASMLCLDRKFHQRKRVMSCLAGMFYYWATLRRLTHILAPANPDIEERLLETGYRRVGPRFQHPSGVEVTPLILDVRETDSRLAEFVHRHKRAHFLSSFERAFYEAGETVLRQGEAGECAYVILEGAAVMETPRQSGGVRRVHFTAGDIFGESSLLTGRTYCSNVIASRDLDLMVLSAETLRTQLQSTPDKALKLLQLLGNRVLDLLH